MRGFLSEFTVEVNWTEFRIHLALCKGCVLTLDVPKSSLPSLNTFSLSRAHEEVLTGRKWLESALGKI
jgi:hypothetical protein